MTKTTKQTKVMEKTKTTKMTEKTKKSKVTKKTWSLEEKKAVAEQFKHYFTNKVHRLPGKNEIIRVQDKTPALHGRAWKNIKDFIRNCQRKVDPLDFL